MGQLEDPAVDRAGQVEGEEGGRDLDDSGHHQGLEELGPMADVVMSNQASTTSRVAVAVAGNCTRASTRKAM